MCDNEWESLFVSQLNLEVCNFGARRWAPPSVKNFDLQNEGADSV